jgi:hypothetical protein
MPGGVVSTYGKARDHDRDGHLGGLPAVGCHAGLQAAGQGDPPRRVVADLEHEHPPGFAP